MNHRILQPLFMIVLVGIAMTGCQKQSPIIGTWTVPINTPIAKGTQVTTFGPDGKYKTVNTLRGEVGTLIAIDSGTYKMISSDRVKITLVDVEWQMTGGRPAVVESTLRKVREGKKKLIEAVNDTDPALVTFKTNDEMILEDAGDIRFFKRKID